MTIRKIFYAVFFICGTALGLYSLLWLKPPVAHKTVTIESVGKVSTAKPMWGVRASTLVFADSQQFSADNLAQRLADLGVAATVIDTKAFFKLFTPQSNKCFDAKQVSEFIATLGGEIPAVREKSLLVTGIGDGALIPFINAHQELIEKSENISLDFSISVPTGLNLCPPFTTDINGLNRHLTGVPALKSHWRSVWNEKPVEETAVFIKEKAPQADTVIAAYNTPLDTLLINETNAMIGQGVDSPPMPVIEIPADNDNGTVTLFYSGDGGWRDLDRSVADEMAKLDHSVLGVDVLRYFWERKTPEQVTTDLAATMRYYRTKWGVKSFVLAGFSFGADILPVVYNKLPESEKENVALLVFLALGNHADFEVHVAGWLGQSTHEMPLAQELQKINKDKVLCIYGKEEKAKTGTACSSLENSGAKVIELPGGHHFDKDYPKLARMILDNYRQHGIH